MVANIRGYTPNYNFKLINFDTPRWHTLEYDNWNQLDAMFMQFGAGGMRGQWQNSMLYLIGERVFDGASGIIYRCLVEHTSASTGTFSDDRVAHPTYWSIQLGGVPVFRDAWLPGVSYVLGDIVVYNDYEYYLCTAAHVSAPVFPGSGVEWQTVFDATEVVEDAQDAATAAANSATSAFNSANAAQSSENDAETAAEAAADSAYIASSSQGAFRWNFDINTAMANPGVADIQFNNANWQAVTAIAISAQTADAGNPDVSDWIATWDDSTNLAMRGTLYIREATSPENFVVYNITGSIVDNGVWLQVPVAYVAHLGAFSTSDNLSVSFSRTGNTGASGAGSGDMLAANNLSELTATQLIARGNIGLGETDVPKFNQLRITNPPTQNDHVVTKGYMDTAAALIISDTAPLPAAVSPGALWWESDSGMLYVYYDDGTDNPQWVQAVAIPSPNLSNYVQKSGDTMSGPLTLSGDPTNVLHAVPKQYADTKAPEAIVDGRSYARNNLAWSEVPRYQRIPCDGVTQVDIPVPVGANAMRLSGMIVPTSATSMALMLQVSVTAGVFLAATTDYSTNGFYTNPTTPATVYANNGQSWPGMQISTGNTSPNFALIFNGLVKVKRHDATVGRFSGDFYAVVNSNIHNNYHSHATQTNLGSSLSLLALRLKATAGDTWGPDSFISVEWL